MAERVVGHMRVHVRWVCPSCQQERHHMSPEIETIDVEECDEAYEVAAQFKVACGPCDQEFDLVLE